jgi:hypothetical protein
MTKARILADFISDGSPLADGTISVAEVSGAAPLASPTFTGTVVATSLDISGDIDVDGTTNLDVVDIDGAVNMASTLLVTGVLTTTAATVFNGGFAANAASTIATTDNSVNLTLTSTDADANGGPKMNFYRNSASPAAGDVLTQIEHQGKNDAGETVAYMYQNWRAAAVGNGAESGQFDINTYTAGTAYERMGIDPTETVFNNDSADLDFRVESDGNTHMLFVDAGNDRIGINDGTPSYQMDFGGGTTVDRRIQLQRGSDDANQNMLLGWSGIDVLRSSIPLSSAQTNFSIRQVGSDGTRVPFFVDSSGGVILNEDSVASGDFRVESDTNTHALFVDAGNNRIGLFNSAPSAPLHLTAGSSGGSLSDAFLISDSSYVNIAMYSGGADGEIRVGASGILRGVYKAQYAGTRSANDFSIGANLINAITFDSGGPIKVNDGGLSTVDFRVESDTQAHAFFVDAGTQTTLFGKSTSNYPSQNAVVIGGSLRSSYGASLGFENDATGGADGFILATDDTWGIGSGFGMGFGASSSDNFRMFFTTSESVFNERSQNIDFRVESDTNAHMLFVDAGNNQVVVGDSGNYYSKFTVVGSKTISGGIPLNQLSVIDGTAMAANTGGAITLWGNYTTGGAQAEGASIEAVKANGTSGNYQYGIWLKSRTHGGAMDSRLYMDQAQTIFNESGFDTDFRVESDASPYAFYMDAGANSGYGRTKITSSAVYSNTSAGGGTSDTYINGLTIENNEATYTNGGLALVNKYSWGYGSAIKWYNIYDGAGTGGTLGETNSIHSQYVSANNMDTVFSSMISGALTETLSIGANGTIVNDGGIDNDFRVESDANTHALFVDAGGSGSIGFGGTDVFSYNQTSGNSVMGYIIDNGSSYGSLTLSNNADRGWSPIYINKFAYTSGDDRRLIQWGVNGGALCNIELNAAGTAVVYQTTSDRRLKENIQDLTGGIDAVKQLRPRLFEWITDEDNTFPSHGFIADEADGIVPEAVTGEANAVDEDGNPAYQSMEYSKLVPVLTAALKEAITKIEDLETRITALENA